MEKKPALSSRSSGTSRRVLRINHYIGLVLMLFIFVAVNLIASRQFYRSNLSPFTYTRISEQSVNIIRALPEPVTLINFVAPEDDDASALISGDLEKLLDDYRYRSNGKVEVRKVNPYINFEEAKAIAQEHKLTTSENVVIVQYRGQTKVLNYREMADVQPSSPWSPAPPKLLAFKAEEVITSAIQSLVQGQAAKVVFLTGRGEYDVNAPERDASGYTRLAEFVKRQNAEVVTLNLLETPAIPDDASLVVIAGPQQPYTPLELDLIRAYLERKDRPGRLMILLDPQIQTGLENLLEPYGVLFNDDLAVTRVVLLGQERLLPQAVATTFSEHPVTQWLIRTRSSLTLGACRSLQIKEPAQQGTPRAVALAMTPEAYWGERDYKNKAASFEKGRDTEGPLTLAAAIDTGKVQDSEVALPGLRVVAVGGGSFLINQLIGGTQTDFFLNAFNWLLDRQSSLGIAPKTPQEFRVNLDDSQRQKLTGIVLLAVPVIWAAAGVLVWWRRRK